ncbi:MAG TPA: condensation domain-containing protein, partial [Pyrinomonadaceae bacterium]|nr:condensation domain-containing protein [Pyrinomonadaceae bacterium]
LVREVTTLYAALVRGEESPLAELPMQYGDYAVWQREYLRGEVLEEQMGYWRERLGGELPVLEIPTDFPRPAVQSFRGGKQHLLLELERSRALKALSQREGVTLFMVLLAAFQTLRYRYSGQTDLIIGTPIANRNRHETEQLIGFFVNTLAIRNDLSGNPTFRQLLRRVKEVMLGAYTHQDVPFEKIVEVLQPERSLNRQPIFQIIITLQNAPGGKLELPGLQLDTIKRTSNISKFDLTVNIVSTGEGLRIGCEYNTDLFLPDTIKRLLEHYERLLGSIVARPDAPLNELGFLSEAEQTLLLQTIDTEAFESEFLF